MNTLSPFPSLRMPGLRDPIAAVRGFVGKCRALACKRGDHGSVLEHNVLDKLVDREASLRDAGAKSAELIAKKISAAQQYFDEAMADGKLSAAERVRHESQLADLYRQLAELSRGLALSSEAQALAAPAS